MRGQTAKRAKHREVARHPRREARDATRSPGPKREQHDRGAVPRPAAPGRVVLEVDGLAKGYGGPTVFDDVTFAVERGERLLVMGLNGAGKTSLMRILAGQTDADSGDGRLGHGVSAGYYAQEHEGITAGRSVIDHLRDRRARPTQQLRTLLGMFGLTGDIAFQDAGTLSGGEKTKLALAQLVAGRHNLLLLDEPTNNLDPPSRDAIGRALAAWPGEIVLGYPFHLGVTEAGTAFAGTVKSSIGLGILLHEGIGDTIRVSLAAEPQEEVRVAWEILIAGLA